MTLVSYIILGLILNLKIKASSSLSSSGIRGYLGGGDRLTFDFNVINISENYIEPLIV
jgi:hypothetical protein